jgi:hypothetical protein
MNRKEFLKKAALASVALNGFSLVDVFTSTHTTPLPLSALTLKQLAPVSPELEIEFQALQQWMINSGWSEFFQKELNADLSGSGDALKNELIKDKTHDPRVAELKNQGKGFDDAAGVRLIEPGNIALSLLYHALASPRVKPGEVRVYPTIKQLDTLENYIYALKKWEDYGIKSNGDHVMAVFAYEYRPAFKTPHHHHADMVYSRTGIARVGNKPIHYDEVNRCYTNKPANGKETQHIAVMPARYGLFVARKVKMDALTLSTMGRYKGTETYRDIYDDRADSNNYFLLPVRKLFANDLPLAGASIEFIEEHVNEKVSILAANEKLKRNSGDLLLKDGSEKVGSSYLVISKENDLIRIVKGEKYKIDNISKNRYFTSYSQKDPNGGFEIDLITEDRNGYYRSINNYKAGRNRPMYVHMAQRVNPNGTIESIPKTALKQSTSTEKTFEDIIDKGGYFVPIYEDSICDGAVTAHLSKLPEGHVLSHANKNVYAAFSIITAPDFFPYVDLFDIMQFDVAPGSGNESNFYEGGVASLASSRIRPNPKLPDPRNNKNSAFPFNKNTDTLANTLTAVVSTLGQAANKKWVNDYATSSYLPDVCSSVFAPGWDITYANKTNGNLDVATYLSTQGLGAPFVEDMKLCAASNGMWAVACPDAARVYQGTVTTHDASHNNWYANPTAIPLMDDELGFHEKSPAKKNTTGWDGEQGPFLEWINGKWNVNFTDLGRADYVQNCLSGKFDMSKLRELKTAELTSRMSALKKCITSLKSTAATTNSWLVSAEKMKDGHFDGHGIPPTLIHYGKEWATRPQFNVGPTENCYLLLFVDFNKDAKRQNRSWADTGVNVKRRLIKCRGIYLFQVSDSLIKGCTVMNNGSILKDINWDKWNLV